MEKGYTAEDYLNFIHQGRFDKIGPTGLRAILEHVKKLEEDCVRMKDEIYQRLKDSELEHEGM